MFVNLKDYCEGHGLKSLFLSMILSGLEFHVRVVVKKIEKFGWSQMKIQGLIK